MQLKKNKKKKKKILLFLVSQPLTQHLCKRIGVNTSYKNWQMLYWNFLPLLRKNVDKVYSDEKKLIQKGKNYIRINSFLDLYRECHKIPKDFYFVNFAGDFFLTSLLDRFLYFRGGTKLLIHPGKSCEYKKKRIKYFNIIRDLINLNKIYLIKKSIGHLIGKIKIILNNFIQTRPKILFAGNYKTYLEFKKDFKNQQVFKINGHDFDNFINLKQKKTKEKNIVFIDQMLDNPFEFNMRKGLFARFSPSITENYWESMEKFFNLVIKKFPKNNFLVAAHHRRNKSKIPINKKFVFNKTTQLIRDAKLVLCHNSTAHKLAVLFRRPIIFVNMDLFKLKSYEVVEETNELSKELGTYTVKINKNGIQNKENIDLKKILKINKKKYEKFQSNFICFPNYKNYGLWKTILQQLDSRK